MALVVHDPGVVGDVDPEGEDRDQFHIEEMLNEWTDEPLFRHDVYPESDGEDNADGAERFHTHIRPGDGHTTSKHFSVELHSNKLAFQRRGNYCEDVDKKFTQSFNGSLNKAREKPFVAMLETIRRLAMVRIAKRSVESHTHTGSCTPYVALVLSGEHKVASLAKVSTSTNGMYEVKHGSESHRVCLKSYTCTWQKWQIRGIPCENAYGVILDKKLAPEDYHETNAPAVFIPEPPEGDKKMTKEDKKRKKDVNESPTKKAPKNKKQIMHCGICGTADHNFRYHKKDKASQSVLQPSQPEPSQGSLTQA
ncbi:Zinc finger PMZ-type [Arabidopsis suecica]|uniref:Zinc finger PMZ-type n=1 Tax=Arabidopsis suecica TaxID=45249 RepID=A0A8T1ZWG7_ARASU|nr:Zinc finger PMZ-type [Arabidopsis suecica]